MKLSKLKAGDVMYITDYTRDQHGYKEAIIEKVGRKYVKMHGSSTEFRVEGKHLIGDNWYGRVERAFATEIDAKEFLEYKRLSEEMYRSNIRWHELSLNQLRRIAEILKESEIKKTRT